MGLEALTAALRAAGYGAHLREREPLSAHTSFAVGGPADLLFEAGTLDALVDAVRLARAEGVPWRVLGSGTNVLVADAGIRGVVIVNRCRGYAIGADGTLRAESGALLTDVARAASAAGWAGLAWAVGIPGTIGGAVVNNAGAYGGAMADRVRSVTVLEPSGRREEWGVERLAYAYRTSALKSDPECGRSRIVLEAVLALEPGDREELAAAVRHTEAQRAERVPAGCCAGSVFKRTLQYPAGFLIEQAGLKGRRIGAAEVSAQHANFIMNTGAATARDVRTLIEEVQHEVFRTFALRLEPEIQYIGEWSER